MLLGPMRAQEMHWNRALGLVVAWHVDGRFTVFRQSVTKASRFRAYHAGPGMVVGGQADRLTG